MFGLSAVQSTADDDTAETDAQPPETASSEEDEPARECGRRYFRVRPTESAVEPSSARSQFRRVHGLERPSDGGLLRSLLGRLLSRRDPPTLEVLLVAPGDGSLR